MPKLIDLTGHRFGRLMVVSKSNVRTSGKVHWNCACDCGGSTTSTAGNLRSGISTSCGCFKAERITEAKFQHGRNGKDPTYGTWMAMRMRCTNPSNDHYQYYGARGINVCDRWNDFTLFLADMGERPDGMTIDRIDVNGNYEPGNCKWSTTEEQVRNKRNSRIIEWHGKELTLAELSRETGVSQGTIHRRLAGGLSVNEAVKKPTK